MTNKPKKLKLGWVIKEEAGVTVINDYAVNKIWRNRKIRDNEAQGVLGSIVNSDIM